MTQDYQRVLSLLRRRFPGTPAVELGDFLWRHGTPLDAFFYRNLFWPDFVEIDGMILWSDAVQAYGVERIRSVLQHYDGDLARTERSFNLVEVPHLFGNPDPTGEIDDGLWDDLTRSLRDMWECRLRFLFPGREFKFELDLGEEVSLLFYEVRGAT